ncbi:LysR substrate binding domain protein [compost metagenome]
MRTDDLNAYQAAVSAGLGVGFLARYVARQNPDLVPLLPMLPIPPLPVWLAVHREIRSNPRIRAVWDFLARALPQALS